MQIKKKERIAMNDETLLNQLDQFKIPYGMLCNKREVGIKRYQNQSEYRRKKEPIDLRLNDESGTTEHLCRCALLFNHRRLPAKSGGGRCNVQVPVNTRRSERAWCVVNCVRVDVIDGCVACFLLPRIQHF